MTNQQETGMLETATFKQMKEKLERHLQGLIGVAPVAELNSARASWHKALAEGPSPLKGHARVFLRSHERFLGFNVEIGLLKEAEELANKAVAGLSKDQADPSYEHETATLGKNVEQLLLLTPSAENLMSRAPEIAAPLLDHLDAVFLIVLGLLRRSLRRRDPNAHNHGGEGQILFCHNVRALDPDRGALLYTRVQMKEMPTLSPDAPVAGSA